MEVSPECGERLPTGKSVGVSEVEKEDIEEPIPGQRETKRERKKQHPGAFASAAFAGPETAGANVPESWRGWRLGRRSRFRCSSERKDVKVAATVSALVGRSVLISLVPSVAEADVATVDGLESTIKSARDRKRWKLAVV
ncbi:hypothetical protein GW17_00042860 [Ensete ventricosum]|nr:hypothetical protein GW17_00042860 [Ensete ventricosum]